VEKLESASPGIARATIADLVNGPTFATWYPRPAGAFAMANLEQGVVSRLGAKTQLVALSEDTLKKQLREHPEITIQEYALIQDIVDRGREIIDAKDGSLIYVLKEEGYVAVIKATRTGKAVFMTSFRRLSSRAIQRDGEVRRLLLKAVPKTKEYQADGGASQYDRSRRTPHSYPQQAASYGRENITVSRLPKPNVPLLNRKCGKKNH
jgi:hypothetical protein